MVLPDQGREIFLYGCPGLKSLHLDLGHGNRDVVRYKEPRIVCCGEFLRLDNVADLVPDLRQLKHFEDLSITYASMGRGSDPDYDAEDRAYDLGNLGRVLRPIGYLTGLKSLDLNGNYIGFCDNSGAIGLLSDTLSRLQTLTKLTLERNFLSDYSSNRLVPGLRALTRLKHLSLRDNLAVPAQLEQLEPENKCGNLACVLSQLMDYDDGKVMLDGLELLDLCNCSLKARAANPLANALLGMGSLKHLLLDDNDLLWHPSTRSVSIMHNQ